MTSKKMIRLLGYIGLVGSAVMGIGAQLTRADIAPPPETQRIYTLKVSQSLSKVLMTSVSFQSKKKSVSQENNLTCNIEEWRITDGNDSLLCRVSVDMKEYRCRFYFPQCLLRVQDVKDRKAGDFLSILSESSVPVDIEAALWSDQQKRARDAKVK